MAEPNRRSYAKAQVSAMFSCSRDLIYHPETGEFEDWPSGIDGHQGMILIKNAHDTGYDLMDFPNPTEWEEFFLSESYYTEWLAVLDAIDQRLAEWQELGA